MSTPSLIKCTYDSLTSKIVLMTISRGSTKMAILSFRSLVTKLVTSMTSPQSTSTLHVIWIILWVFQNLHRKKALILATYQWHAWHWVWHESETERQAMQWQLFKSFSQNQNTAKEREKNENTSCRTHDGSHKWKDCLNNWKNRNVPTTAANLPRVATRQLWEDVSSRQYWKYKAKLELHPNGML